MGAQAIYGIIIYILIGLVIGIGFTTTWHKIIKKHSLKLEAERIIKEALKEKEALIKEAEIIAKEIQIKERERLEKEFEERKREFRNWRNRIIERENYLNLQLRQLEHKIKNLEEEKSQFEKEKTIIIQQKKELMKKLEKLSGISREEARRMILQEIEKELDKEKEDLITKKIEELKITAEKEAKEILVSAMQRVVTDTTNDVCIDTVTLPDEDMKGRIIGREGRNIKTLESLTGVDIIIDDTPDVVLISSYDPYRREIAKLSILKLVEDGRIHPSRIEEVVEKTKKEMEKIIYETGESVVYELGIHGLPAPLINLIGKLKYRLSYGQNTLTHSVEVAYLSTFIAGEIKEDEEMAKKIGLLHDIGKCLSTEGSHALAGAEYLKKFNFPDVIINAVASHHDEVETNSIYGVILKIADAISASRPGARRESLENYLHRIKKLEKIGMSFEGVEKCYAIQAGRELRVIVSSDTVSDKQALILARDIARKIENEMTYPGHIKVTVIRETKIVEYAK